MNTPAKKAPARKVREGKDPAVAWAEKLVRDMRAGFRKAETAVVEFIRCRGWEALGIESFDKFWTEQMADIKIAHAVLPNVLAQLFDEGLTDEQAAAAVSGVGVDTAGAVRRQLDHGVTPEQATTTTPRRTPSAITAVWTLRVPAPKKAAWAEAAARNGVTVKQIIDGVVADLGFIAAIDAAIDALG
jgi:hypothetical protein